MLYNCAWWKYSLLASKLYHPVVLTTLTYAGGRVEFGYLPSANRTTESDKAVLRLIYSTASISGLNLSLPNSSSPYTSSASSGELLMYALPHHLDVLLQDSSPRSGLPSVQLPAALGPSVTPTAMTTTTLQGTARVSD